MRQILFFLLISLFFTLALPATGENLIKDPSFEDIIRLTEQSSPWRVAAFNTEPGFSEYTLEKGKGHSGETYAKIINKKANHTRIVQSVNVEPGKTYRLSCWAKTENVGTDLKGANITVENIIEYSPSITGTTTDWVYTEMYMKIGEGINSIDIAVSLGGYYGTNTGTAFFDDVTVEEVMRVPRGAVTGVKGEIAEEKEPPRDPGEEEMSGRDKEQGKIPPPPKPMTVPVIIALILGILCAGFVVVRIVLINLGKKRKKESP
jgi:hypothetical protein